MKLIWLMIIFPTHPHQLAWHYLSVTWVSLIFSIYVPQHHQRILDPIYRSRWRHIHPIYPPELWLLFFVSLWPLRTGEPQLPVSISQRRWCSIWIVPLWLITSFTIYYIIITFMVLLTISYVVSWNHILSDVEISRSANTRLVSWIHRRATMSGELTEFGLTINIPWNT